MIYLAYSGRRHTAAVAQSHALDIDALSVAYPGTRQLALHSVSLTVPIGARIALVGANGSGKSTILKSVAGLLRPQSGTIRIYGNPVGACHHRVAYLPQRSDVDWRFPVSVERLVLAGRYVHRGWLQLPTAADRRHVQRVLDQLELADLAKRQISALSGGQQQRALLARALVQEADLLLLDEPLSAVDARSRQIIAGVLDQLRLQGKSALVATHHVDRIADEYDDLIALADGYRIEAAAWNVLA
jgi:manganese/zinc/iron transport system ATP- binding protein